MFNLHKANRYKEVLMRTFSHLSNGWSWPRHRMASDLVKELLSDFDQVSDSFLQPEQAATINFQPRCDISEYKDHYLVSFDIPGMKREDIKIEVNDNQLHISGERHRELKNDKNQDGFQHYERSYGRFQRVFSLPKNINADKIEAHYEDGVLNLALPKMEDPKGRTIQIQSGKPSFFSRLVGTDKSGSEKNNQ